MARYFIELAYDGTAYHGWQAQPNAVSVQQTLEKAFATLLKEDIALTGCGRTDTGVHASYFVAHFDSDTEAVELQEDLVFRLNGYLPDDIAVRSISKVDDRMHARFSATYRQYVYVIRRTKPLFNRPFCYYYYADLDVDRMNAACAILKEYKDFTSFSKLHTDVKTNNCRIMEAVWTGHDDGYEFTIRADRFLRNMVRSVVGTMIEIGSGKMEPEEIREVIEAGDRSSAGMSVPAKGLFLVDVGYER